MMSQTPVFAVNSAPESWQSRQKAQISIITAAKLDSDIHPIAMISTYNKALEAPEIVECISIPTDVDDATRMRSLTQTSNGTSRHHRLTGCIGLKTVDIKHVVRAEKISGGRIEQSKMLKAVILNKDFAHPNMRSWTEKSGIVLFDWPLEHKKGESQTNMGFSKEADWARVQEMEEERVEGLCYKILQFNTHPVIAEKGFQT
ncbi:hypothetical protein NLJ89_g3587 [Agrocybe chaxingu]|uniref:Uncharacterized protein n=1 Tax=Agrocybe chaxingu TaxID=84603 RepID=A0A9W8K279_9AGAR|nr:hypothetical protein NLJ89_g3587 [Agrocybe chaxingu]